MRPTIPDVHDCVLLAKNDFAGLYPLPPYASRWDRFIRFFRKLCVMEPKNMKSRNFYRNKSTMLAEQKRHARSPYPFVIHPFSRLSTFCEVVFFLSWFGRFFTVPIVSVFYFSSSIILQMLLLLISSLQSCVFFYFFFVGYVDNDRREIIIHPKKILFHHLRTYFVFDLIVFQDNLVLSFIHPGDPPILSYRTCYLISLVITIAYLMRFKYFLRILRDITVMLHFSKTLYNVIFHIFVIGVILHISTCTMFSLPKFIYGDTYPEDSWLVQANIDKLDEIHFMKLYAEALLLSFCFFFGIRHNKYMIRITNEEIILTVITIIGRLYTLYMMADLLRIFGLVGASESKYEEYLGQLEEYICSKNLPDELRVRLLKYFEYRLQKHYFNEGHLLATLSELLKSEMFLFNARKLLESEKILRSVPRSSLGALFAFMKSETFLPTDVITRAGTKIENVFFILSGTVAVTNTDDIEITHLDEGDIFGLWVAADGTIMYTHVAVEITELLYLPKKVFLDLLDEHPDVSKYIDVMAKKKMRKFAELESSSQRGGEDVISALRSGKLLEKQAVRDMNMEIDF
ncbi:hypothetical protein JTB14_025995 [Gonioctena quinquepunctata]|nr:hypothetical protein JTB14_025995 [Gonioctena quinquepunctata]